MMNFAGFTTKKHKQLWCEVANTAMMLDNILVHEQDRAPPHKMFYDQDPKYGKHLQTFGEMCVTVDTSNKWDNQDSIHKDDCVCFLLLYTTCWRCISVLTYENEPYNIQLRCAMVRKVMA